MSARARIAALIAIAALAAAPAQADEPLRFEVQAGVCEHGQAGRGIWWNDAYPTEIDLRSACWQIGVSQTPWHARGWSIGWRADYVDLGRYQADNVFARYDDEQFSGVTGEDCDLTTGRGCLGRGRINGHTRGVSLGALAEHSAGALVLGVEAGAFLYYNRFAVAVTSYPQDQPLAAMTWGDIQATPYAGITARYGVLSATGRIYGNVVASEHNCAGCSGITHGPAWQAMIGLQAAFQ
jgi:hypothetical protein